MLSSQFEKQNESITTLQEKFERLETELRKTREEVITLRAQAPRSVSSTVARSRSRREELLTGAQRQEQEPGTGQTDMMKGRRGEEVRRQEVRGVKVRELLGMAMEEQLGRRSKAACRLEVQKIQGMEAEFEATRGLEAQKSSHRSESRTVEREEWTIVKRSRKVCRLERNQIKSGRTNRRLVNTPADAGWLEAGHIMKERLAMNPLAEPSQDPPPLTPIKAPRSEIKSTSMSPIPQHDGPLDTPERRQEQVDTPDRRQEQVDTPDRRQDEEVLPATSPVLRQREPPGPIVQGQEEGENGEEEGELPARAPRG